MKNLIKKITDIFATREYGFKLYHPCICSLREDYDREQHKGEMQ